MSKITFRADDDLIERLEAFDASKSEVMREALRTYLDREAEPAGAERADGVNAAVDPQTDTLDDLLVERVDALIAERLDAVRAPRKPQDINVNIALDGDSGSANVEEDGERKTAPPDRENASDDERKTCIQCGDTMEPSAVYCANCGEKASHRVFCDCGDEVRSDWAYCPSCGRRTPAADVLDSS